MAIVYATLIGTLLAAFRPVSFPPFALRGAKAKYFLYAPVVLCLTLAASGLLYIVASPWTGGARTALTQVLVVATDVRRLGAAPTPVWAIAFFRGTVLAPLFEELLFRGVMLAWLPTRIPMLGRPL